MAKRLLGLLLLLIGLQRGIFVDPYWSLCVFSIFTHVPPTQLNITAFRAPLVLSLATLGAYVVSNRYDRKFDHWPVESWLMIAIYIGANLSVTNAYDTKSVHDFCADFLKFVIYFILMVNILDRDYKLKWFYHAQIFSAAWMVYRCFDLRGTTGARFENRDGAVINDSNQFAAANVLMLPLVIRKVFEGPAWMRFGALIGVFGILMTIMITGSRGGFLGLATVFIMTLLIYRNRRKQIIIGCLVMGLAAWPFLPGTFVNRVEQLLGMAGVTEEEEDVDASAGTRLAAWQLSYDLWKKNPFFGVGMKNFGYYKGYLLQGKEWGERGHVAHSIWFEALGEGGLVVTVPLISMMILFYIRTWLIARRYIGTPFERTAEDIYALQIGYTGFLVCATFVNRMTYEPVYWWCGLAVCYMRVQKNQLRKWRKERALAKAQPHQDSVDKRQERQIWNGGESEGNGARRTRRNGRTRRQGALYQPPPDERDENAASVPPDRSAESNGRRRRRRL